MTLHVHQFDALDAWDTLGYLAALGLIKVLDEAARAQRVQRPRMHFSDGARAVAVVECVWTVDEIVAIVLEDAAAQAANPVLNVWHDKEGNPCGSDGKELGRDLKPSPRYAREVLLACATGPRPFSDLAAGLFTEIVQDENGRTKPTAFHFTAGPQAFLAMARTNRKNLMTATVNEALHNWGEADRDCFSMGWEGTGARIYALRARNPSGDKKGGLAGPNWLALRGLSMLPVRVGRGALLTCGVEGAWKTASFAWPIWTRAAQAGAIVSLLRLDVRALSAAARAALGVTTVLAAAMPRHDQGGYGSFAPAAVLPPARPHGAPGRTAAPAE